MNHKALTYLLMLMETEKIPLALKRQIFLCYPNLEEFYRSQTKRINEKIKNISLETIQKIQNQTQQFEKYNRLALKIKNENIKWTSLLDESYPERLKEIYDAPLALFYQGNIKLLNLNRPNLAVVGSRQVTEYGKKAIEKIIPPLFQYDFTITSGMAFGADAYAHEICLQNNQPTITVLAQGVSKAYPRSHKALFHKIIDKGLVISEFALSQESTPPYLFPRRNRIVSGISDGVLIVEAKEKSGSLITARLALEQNREVYAIPGDIFKPLSQGCLKLIQNGAKPVKCFQDILEDFQVLKPSSQPDLFTQQKQIPNFSSLIEKKIYELCRPKSHNIDQIIDFLDHNEDEIMSSLVKMELSGHIKELPGKQFLSQ